MTIHQVNQVQAGIAAQVLAVVQAGIAAQVLIVQVAGINR
jgi:hypothetical protein